MASRWPCRTATILPAAGPPGPARATCTDWPDLLDPRRADEHRVHRAGRRAPATSRSVSNESSWRPNALRRTTMSSPPKVCWPAIAVARCGRRAGSARRRCRTPAARRATRSRSGSMQPERAGELVDRARLAAGDARARRPPSSSSARAHAARRRRRARAARARCSRTSPWRARTPTRASARSRRHQPRSARRCGAGRSATLMPTIASPRPRRHLGDDVGVVEERGRLDDRRGALRPGCRT